MRAIYCLPSSNKVSATVCFVSLLLTLLHWKGRFYCPPGRKTRFYCPPGRKKRFYCPPGWKTSFSVPGGTFLEGYFFSDQGFHHTHQCSNVGNNDTKKFFVPSTGHHQPAGPKNHFRLFREVKRRSPQFLLPGGSEVKNFYGINSWSVTLQNEPPIEMIGHFRCSAFI